MLTAPSPLLAASFTWLTWFGLEWFWKVCGLSPSSPFFSVCFGKSMNFRCTRLELSKGFQWWKKKTGSGAKKKLFLYWHFSFTRWWNQRGKLMRRWAVPCLDTGRRELVDEVGESFFFFLLYGRWPFWCGSKRVGQTAGTQRAHTVQSDHMVKFNQRPNAISIS